LGQVVQDQQEVLLVVQEQILQLQVCLLLHLEAVAAVVGMEVLVRLA
jgi:hypothetical protein